MNSSLYVIFDCKMDISLFLANVKAHPPLGARASVECGVDVVVIINAYQQGGS